MNIGLHDKQHLNFLKGPIAFQAILGTLLSSTRVELVPFPLTRNQGLLYFKS